MPEFLIFWLLWAIIMISSRLILGVHYISDIIAGILLGSIAMIIFHLIGWLPTIPWDISEYIP
jgi:membrane-associated phospholipid phosphatase